MSAIYTPKGKAREYSPLAFNYHAGLCQVGCRYCYGRSIVRGKPAVINQDKIMADLEKSIKKIKQPEQVLLNFLHDPYEPLCAQITPGVVRTLAAGGFPVAILSKCLRVAHADVNLYQYIPRIKIGTTLTCYNRHDSLKWEPGADLPEARLNSLRFFHDHGIKTFVSFEPVIYPEQTLWMIEEVAPYVDQVKIGKWNHAAAACRINWLDFGMRAVELTRRLGMDAYFKEDLRACMPGFHFTDREKNHTIHEMKP